MIYTRVNEKTVFELLERLENETNVLWCDGKTPMSETEDECFSDAIIDRNVAALYFDKSVEIFFRGYNDMPVVIETQTPVTWNKFVEIVKREVGGRR